MAMREPKATELETKNNLASSLDNDATPDMKLPPAVRKECLEAMKTFNIRPDDIIVATYPKSGTHWMVEIIGLILADGYPDKVDREKTKFHLEFCDFSREDYEDESKPYVYTYEVLEKFPSPRVISTHLTKRQLPPGVFTNKPRFIYVARNPKDVANSLKQFEATAEVSIEQSINLITPANGICGSYFAHVKDFWEMRNNENVLFLLYEDIVKNTAQEITKVANLIGRSLSPEALERVLHNSTIEQMRKHTEHIEKQIMIRGVYKGLTFVRKGKIGDWKNYFTVAESEAFDEVIRDKMEGCSMPLIYE